MSRSASWTIAPPRLSRTCVHTSARSAPPSITNLYIPTPPCPLMLQLPLPVAELQFNKLRINPLVWFDQETHSITPLVQYSACSMMSLSSRTNSTHLTFQDMIVDRTATVADVLEAVRARLPTPPVGPMRSLARTFSYFCYFVT